MFREKHLKKKNSGLVFFLYFNLKRRQCSVKGGPVVKKTKQRQRVTKPAGETRRRKRKKKIRTGFPKYFQCDDDGDVFFSTSFLASFWRGTTRDICIAITPLNTSKSLLMYGMYLYKFIAFYMYRYIFFYFMSQKTLNERNEPECRQWDKKAAERKLMFVVCLLVLLLLLRLPCK